MFVVVLVFVLFFHVSCLFISVFIFLVFTSFSFFSSLLPPFFPCCLCVGTVGPQNMFHHREIYFSFLLLIFCFFDLFSHFWTQRYFTLLWENMGG